MSFSEHGEALWPKFGKISIAVEGFIYYSHYSCKIVIHDMSKWFEMPSVHSGMHETVLLLSGVFSFILGYLADNVAGKYQIVFLTYIFTSIPLLVGTMSVLYPHISPYWRSQVFIYSVYCWFPFFAVEATRVALISEQFKLPQSLRSLKLFFFLFMLSRYAGSGVAGLLMKVEQYFGGSDMQLVIRLAMLVFVVFSYVMLLLFMKKKIRRKRIEVGIVDNVIACIVSALYNRAFARRKMPANTKWIDYSDAKHYKETKDSAVQLTQMSLIFLPFSLFFGLNEYLDVIWMEQNDWIARKDENFISGLSMITIYHAVDIIFIPVFEYLIEFVAPKTCSIILTDLQLIGSAIFLLGLAYLSTTILQSSIENGNEYHDPALPTVRFFNTMYANVTLNTPFAPMVILEPGNAFEALNVSPSKIIKEKEQLKFPAMISSELNGSLPYKQEDHTMLTVDDGATTSFLITADGVVTLPPLADYSDLSSVIDFIHGATGDVRAEIRLRKITDSHGHEHGRGHGGHGNILVDERDDIRTVLHNYLAQNRLRVPKGNWEISFKTQETELSRRNVTFLPRTVYYIFLWRNPQGRVEFHMGSSNKAQPAVIWHALPQIVLRSLADGIGKISTYYFTYTQSPRKLRATAFGVLYFAQYAFPGIFGLLASLWVQGLTAFTLSIYTFVAFIALILFIYFSLKYEEI
ncbi:Hypothetical protein NTJ_01712 [Nesidiocoris tenuis]|uniref:Major facilitator superfamily associated domain-containing protein n=1 Tax=Nesidiocoris tenuis TaxID=355587 RepID=A0ABN7ADG7_9HEMI|nr:Hypothetical protein NTJ_01712 [Nesidiocoris tenuis]